MFPCLCLFPQKPTTTSPQKPTFPQHPLLSLPNELLLHILSHLPWHLIKVIVYGMSALKVPFLTHIRSFAFHEMREKKALRKCIFPEGLRHVVHDREQLQQFIAELRERDAIMSLDALNAGWPQVYYDLLYLSENADGCQFCSELLDAASHMQFYLSERFSRARESFKSFKNVQFGLTQHARFLVTRTFLEVHLALNTHDEAVMLRTIEDFPHVYLEYVPQEMRQRRGFVLQALRHNAHVVRFLKEEWALVGEDMIRRILRQNALFLHYMPEEFRNNRSIVEFAVRQHGEAFAAASETLRSDREFVLQMAHLGAWTLNAIPEILLYDEDIVRVSVANNGLLLSCAPEHFRADRLIVQSAIKENKRALDYASAELRQILENGDNGTKKCNAIHSLVADGKLQ